MSEFNLFGFGEATFTDAPITNELPIRSEENGVMAFHAGVEMKLLVHLKTHLEPGSSTSLVLSKIDEFCYQTHWMMHVGNEKREILSSALKTALLTTTTNTPFQILELGTYCGYSSVLFCELLNFLSPGRPYKIITIEIDEKNASIARQIHSLAGVGNFVEVVTASSVQAALTTISKSILFDFLFVDHDKDLYLSDMLHAVRDLKIMRSKAVVCADNVIMGAIDDYRDFCASDKGKQIFSSTETKKSFIEYSKNERNDTTNRYKPEEYVDGVEVSKIK